MCEIWWCYLFCRCGGRRLGAVGFSSSGRIGMWIWWELTMGRWRYRAGGGGITIVYAGIGADVIPSMSNICYFMEIAVVVFIIPVRLQIIDFGRVESWLMEFWVIIFMSFLKWVSMYVGWVCESDWICENGEDGTRLAAVVFLISSPTVFPIQW